MKQKSPIQILKRKFSCSCKKLSIIENDPDVTVAGIKGQIHRR